MRSGSVKGSLCCFRFFEELGKTQTEKWGEEETKIEKWVGKTKSRTRNEFIRLRGKLYQIAWKP